MTHDLIHGSSRTHVLHGARRNGPAVPRDGGLELPVVIRPVPLQLRDVERRVHRDEAFARLLRERPEFLGTVARAILARDEAARQRFASAQELADHLHGLRGLREL